MLVSFLYALRDKGVPVGAQELLALATALRKEVHEHTLNGFYYVARSLCVHTEAHLDPFDEAFAAFFKGIETKKVAIQDDLWDWLKHPHERVEPKLRKLLEEIDPETLRQMFEDRLREQSERHDGGNHWVGTGGTSPFGHSGAAREGYRIGGQGRHGMAIKVAEKRQYRPYRQDLTLDIRQLGMAMKKLRTFVREGAEDELDLEATIDATAKNAGELDVILRPERRPNTRVVLLMDIGGSMTPYTHLVSRLFSAASKATHFKSFHSFYFHNCVYDRVYRDERLMNPLSLVDLFAKLNPQHKLIVVGDALMGPYELLSPRGSIFFEHEIESPGIDCLRLLKQNYPHAVWLNPEPVRFWRGTTIEMVRRVFPMYSLTISGLGEAIEILVRRQPAAIPSISAALPEG